MQMESRKQFVSQYDEKAHLDDFIKINAELKEQIKNFVQEPLGVRKDQLEYRLRNYFSDERIKRIKDEHS